MIGQKNNGQWTTLLGEHLVRDILELRGENPRNNTSPGNTPLPITNDQGTQVSYIQ